MNNNNNNNNHPLKDIMDISMARLKDLVDVNTIIGDRIITEDGRVIIPISKVSFGFGSGGTEFPSKSQNQDNTLKILPFGGGGGGGVTITPIGFLISDKNGVSLLEISNGQANNIDKIINSIPNAVNKLSDVFSKKNKKDDLSKQDILETNKNDQ